MRVAIFKGIIYYDLWWETPYGKQKYKCRIHTHYDKITNDLYCEPYGFKPDKYEWFEKHFCRIDNDEDLKRLMEFNKFREVRNDVLDETITWEQINQKQYEWLGSPQHVFGRRSD